MGKYMNFKYVISRVKTQKHPIRFLLSRILWYSGLCKMFVVNLSSGVKIRFYPTSTSTALWTDPFCFDSDGVNLIKDYLSAGDIFIDVGANIGHLTLTGAKKVGNSGQVISIEPHPRTFKFLNKNIDLNGFKNVKTYNLAIGDKNGELCFSDIRSDDQNFITEDGTVKVDIKRLDDLFFGKKVDLLKIDTEGYELFVLKGAANILSKTELVHLEIYQTNFERYGYYIKDIVDLLFKNNFKVFRFLSENELKEIDNNYLSEKCENLIAIKDVNSFREKMKNLTITCL